VTGTDETLPVADDDFPEFASPPQQKPDLTAASEAEKRRLEESARASAQENVDQVIARLKRRREEREN